MAEGNTKRRWVWILVPLMAVILGFFAWSPNEPPQEEFCEAYGVLAGNDVVTVDDISLLIGEPIYRRDPCNGDDLWHYFDEDLVGIDGVMFDNCEISWVGGGRSAAAAEGIDC